MATCSAGDLYRRALCYGGGQDVITRCLIATMPSGLRATCRDAVVGSRRGKAKDIESHSVRALLASRALLVKIKRDPREPCSRSSRTLGLVIGRAKFNVFAVRAEELIEGCP